MDSVQIDHYYGELLITFGICLTTSPPSPLIKQNSPPVLQQAILNNAMQI
jgi:hypothetical protein